MPTTPSRGWIYPAAETNPYFDEIVGFFNAQDTDVQTLFTARPWTSSLIADSTTLTNPFTAFPHTAFSKTLTLPAGVLNVAGTQVEMYASGIFTSGVETNATMTLLARITPAAVLFSFGTPAVPASVTGHTWQQSGVLTVRTTGSSGILVPSYGNTGLYPNAMMASWGDDGATITADLTAAQTLSIHVSINPVMTSPSFTTQLRALMVRVIYPTTTVS